MRGHLHGEPSESQINGLSDNVKTNIEERIGKLIKDPWHNTEFLKGQYRKKENRNEYALDT